MREQDIRKKTEEILAAYAALTGEDILPSLEEFLMLRKHAERELMAEEKGRPGRRPRTDTGTHRPAEERKRDAANTSLSDEEAVSRMVANILRTPPPEAPVSRALATTGLPAGRSPSVSTDIPDAGAPAVSEVRHRQSEQQSAAEKPHREAEETPPEKRNDISPVPTKTKEAKEPEHSMIADTPLEDEEDEVIPEIRKTSYDILRGIPDIYN